MAERRHPQFLLEEYIHKQEQLLELQMEVGKLAEQLAEVFPPGCETATVKLRVNYADRFVTVYNEGDGVVAEDLVITQGYDLEWPAKAPDAFASNINANFRESPGAELAGVDAIARGESFAMPDDDAPLPMRGSAEVAGFGMRIKTADGLKGA